MYKADPTSETMDAISIHGAREHNLKNLSLAIPRGQFVVVTGVSGSGKSTLVHDILYKELHNRIWKTQYKVGAFGALEGAEQLDKIMEEVAKAQSPASEYGKVAEHLKNAVKQMQQAQSGKNSDAQKQQAKSEAAQSLADAAKELDKLAQQMQDAQQLAQMMEMLERAQQAIQSGKGWGQCKGGPFGSLRAHVNAGKLSEQTLHAEMGQIVAGLKPGRERDTG